MTAGWQLARLGQLLRRRPGFAAAFAATFVVVSALGVAVIVAARATSALEATLADDVQLVALVREDVDDAAAARTVDVVRGLPGVRSVAFVDSEAALARLRAHAERLRGVGAGELEGIEDGFLPRSLEVTLDPRSTAATTVAARLGAMPELTDVDDLGDSLARVRGFVATARTFVRAVDVVAIAAAVAVLLACAMLARRARDEESAVLLLVGATPWQVRLPGRMAAAIAALVGAAIGVAGAFAAVRFVVAPLASWDVLRGALLGATGSIGARETGALALGSLMVAFVFGGGSAREGAHA